MAITHSKVSAIADGPDTSQVRPSDWNANHVIGANTVGDAEIAAHTTTKITVPVGQISGTLPITKGGTGATAFTAGSILFAASSSVVGQNNAKLFWDNVGEFLGIGIGAPTKPVHVKVPLATTAAGDGLHIETSQGTPRIAVIKFGTGSTVLFGTESNHVFDIIQNNISRLRLNNDGVGIGSTTDPTPETRLHLYDNPAITVDESSVNPANPAVGTQLRFYMKADKFVFQFDDAGTVRYKYLDLTGTGVTWVHTTTPP